MTDPLVKTPTKDDIIDLVRTARTFQQKDEAGNYVVPEEKVLEYTELVKSEKGFSDDQLKRAVEHVKSNSFLDQKQINFIKGDPIFKTQEKKSRHISSTEKFIEDYDLPLIGNIVASVGAGLASKSLSGFISGSAIGEIASRSIQSYGIITSQLEEIDQLPSKEEKSKAFSQFMPEFYAALEPESNVDPTVQSLANISTAALFGKAIDAAITPALKIMKKYVAPQATKLFTPKNKPDVPKAYDIQPPDIQPPDTAGKQDSINTAEAANEAARKERKALEVKLEELRVQRVKTESERIKSKSESPEFKAQLTEVEKNIEEGKSIVESNRKKLERAKLVYEENSRKHSEAKKYKERRKIRELEDSVLALDEQLSTYAKFNGYPEGDVRNINLNEIWKAKEERLSGIKDPVPSAEALPEILEASSELEKVRTLLDVTDSYETSLKTVQKTLIDKKTGYFPTIFRKIGEEFKSIYDDIDALAEKSPSTKAKLTIEPKNTVAFLEKNEAIMDIFASLTGKRPGQFSIDELLLPENRFKFSIRQLHEIRHKISDKNNWMNLPEKDIQKNINAFYTAITQDMEAIIDNVPDVASRWKRTMAESRKTYEERELLREITESAVPAEVNAAFLSKAKNSKERLEVLKKDVIAINPKAWVDYVANTLDSLAIDASKGKTIAGKPYKDMPTFIKNFNILDESGSAKLLLEDAHESIKYFVDIANKYYPTLEKRAAIEAEKKAKFIADQAKVKAEKDAIESGFLSVKKKKEEALTKYKDVAYVPLEKLDEPNFYSEFLNLKILGDKDKVFAELQNQAKQAKLKFDEANAKGIMDELGIQTAESEKALKSAKVQLRKAEKNLTSYTESQKSISSKIEDVSIDADYRIFKLNEKEEIRQAQRSVSAAKGAESATKKELKSEINALNKELKAFDKKKAKLENEYKKSVDSARRKEIVDELKSIADDYKAVKIVMRTAIHIVTKPMYAPRRTLILGRDAFNILVSSKPFMKHMGEGLKIVYAKTPNKRALAKHFSKISGIAAADPASEYAMKELLVSYGKLFLYEK